MTELLSISGTVWRGRNIHKQQVYSVITVSNFAIYIINITHIHIAIPISCVPCGLQFLNPWLLLKLTASERTPVVSALDHESNCTSQFERLYCSGLFFKNNTTSINITEQGEVLRAYERS